MDLEDMGRSNRFLHPLRASTQKSSASSNCGHVVAAGEDLHETTLCACNHPVCFHLFSGGLWIRHASTDPLVMQSMATIPALD